MMMHRSSSGMVLTMTRIARSLGVYGFALAQELDTHAVEFVDGLEQVFRPARVAPVVARCDMTEPLTY
jgi:hypothetical protein